MNHIVGLFFLTGFMALLASCGSGEYLVKDPNVMLSYLKEPSDANLDNLVKSYSSTINKNRRSKATQPGLFADYGVAMAHQGKDAEANVWLNKEMDAYPATRPYVMQLKRQLVPQFLNDTTSTFASDTVSVLQANELSPQRRAAAEERAATVLDNSDQQIEAAAPASQVEAPTQPGEENIPIEVVEEPVVEQHSDKEEAAVEQSAKE